MLPDPNTLMLPARTFVGCSAEMSFAANRTKELWMAFRPRVGEVQHRIGEGFYSVQYHPDFRSLTPTSVFRKWACVEVSIAEDIPDGMELLEMREGLWAHFIYRGSLRKFRDAWMWIFNDWLSQSGHHLDDRHHYEHLDHRWLGPENEASEEDVYIPLQTIQD